MTNEEIKKWAEQNKFTAVRTLYAPAQLTLPAAGVIVGFGDLLLPDIPKKSIEIADYPHLCQKCGAPACILFSTVDCSKNCGV